MCILPNTQHLRTTLTGPPITRNAKGRRKGNPDSYKQNRHIQRQNTLRNRPTCILPRGTSRHYNLQTITPTSTENSNGPPRPRARMAVPHL